jgi:hypothetical protein
VGIALNEILCLNRSSHPTDVCQTICAIQIGHSGGRSPRRFRLPLTAQDARHVVLDRLCARFFAAFEAIPNERKQDLILFIAVAKKSTDMASIAKHRASEPNRSPALIRVFLGELALSLDRSIEVLLSRTIATATRACSGLSFFGFYCSRKNTRANDFHSRIRDKSKSLNARFSKYLKIMEVWLK